MSRLKSALERLRPKLYSNVLVVKMSRKEIIRLLKEAHEGRLTEKPDVPTYKGSRLQIQFRYISGEV